MELFRTYLRLLPVSNVNKRGNHARQKVKKALEYSIGQAEIFPSGLLLERILVFFPPTFFSLLSYKNIHCSVKIETIEATEHSEAWAAPSKAPARISACTSGEDQLLCLVSPSPSPGCPAADITFWFIIWHFSPLISSNISQ